MSRTTILAADRTGRLLPAQEFPNSWRGAALVWTEFGKRFLGFEPDWCFGLPSEKPRLQWVWDLTRNEEVPEADRITLMTTFDRALCRARHLERLAECLAETAGWLPSHNSIGEQAEFLRGLVGNRAVRAVGWQQTSVAENVWQVPVRGREDPRPYNIYRDKEHFWVLHSVVILAAGWEREAPPPSPTPPAPASGRGWGVRREMMHLFVTDYGEGPSTADYIVAEGEADARSILAEQVGEEQVAEWEGSPSGLEFRRWGDGEPFTITYTDEDGWPTETHTGAEWAEKWGRGYHGGCA